jgi:membrane protein
MLKKVQGFFALLWKVLLRFIREEGMNHAAALSYYTVFAIPPILIILIMLVGFFWGEVAIERHLFEEMSGVFGMESAKQIKLMLNKLKNDGSTTATFTGIATLIFSSTIVFYSIQHSLNRLWDIHHDIRHGFIKWVIDKFLSLSFLLSIGFLLLVSLGFQSAIAAINNYFGSTITETVANTTTGSVYLDQMFDWLKYVYDEYFTTGFFAIEYGIMLLINIATFTGIFKWLPDARTPWKVALTGGALTAILFEIGEVAIGYKMSTTDFSNSFGAAGALIVVFVWIFYSSCILYFGGVFTQLYGEKLGSPIVPVQAKH